jgi:hypothetical protein
MFRKIIKLPVSISAEGNFDLKIKKYNTNECFLHSHIFIHALLVACSRRIVSGYTKNEIKDALIESATTFVKKNSFLAIKIRSDDNFFLIKKVIYTLCFSKKHIETLTQY